VKRAERHDGQILPAAPFRSAWLLLLCPLLLACAQDQRRTPVGERRPAVSEEEFERRLEAIEALRASGREQEALDRIAASMEDWPSEPLRRRLQRIGFEIRRDRFYRDHPLHFCLEVDRPRFVFGETITVQLKITNLGAERISFPARYRSWLDALLFQPTEESVLQLRLTSKDADGLGSRWGTERMLDVALPDDLVIGAGGSQVVQVPIVLDDGGGSLFRVLRIGAVYRPLAVLGEHGERRYDPFEFPETSVRIFQPSQLHWAAGGLALLATCLAGERLDRPEALFVSAVGLDREQLAAGIEQLARAAPSLDPVRRRCSVAALRILTGHHFADDPVRFLGWWESEGRHLSRAELARAAGLRAADTAGRIWAGGPGSSH